jgi:HEAT repeat protein
MNTRIIQRLLLLTALLMASLSPALGQEKSTADLISAIKSAKGAARIQAIDQLGAQGGEAAVKPLVGLLSDPSAEVRAHAAAALGAVGEPAKSAVPAIIELLKDEDPVVRRQAAQAVAAIRPGPQVTVPLGVKLLEDADPGVRLRILDAVSQAGPAAVPGLIEALSNQKAAYWACLVLREMGPAAKDAVPALTVLLKDPRPEIRREAVLALAAMDAAAAPAADEIAALLNDDHVAIAATFALARMGKVTGDAEAVIRKNAGSQNALLSTTSLWAVAKTHPDDAALRRDATRKLIAALKHEDPFVRVQAARALAALPPAPEITMPIWEEAMADADETTVRHALDALAQLGAAAVPRLVRALENEHHRLEVIYVLTQIGPDAAPATEALANLASDPDEQVAHESLIALAAIGPGAKAAAPELAARLREADSARAAAIAYALGKIDPGAPAARSALAKSLKSDDPHVALLSAWALAQGDALSADLASQAVPVLIAGLKSPTAEARQGAAEALGRLGKLAASAVPALEAAREDEDPSVRDAAQAALAAIEGAKKPK